jgi:hypothetical protein
MSTSIINYNLAIIPGFNELLNSNETNETNENTTNILKLNKIECRTSNNALYKVIRYDKNFLAHDLIPTFGLCRSVIINSNNKVVGFAPPKSISCETFIKKYSSINKDSIIAEEFVEGTMINVFWDSNLGISGGWEITTRNTVGATSTFYKSYNAKTFREMFLEAAAENNLLLQNLNPIYSYSFVMQHPENRIVVPFKKPQLYLVSLYLIENNTNSVIVNQYDPRIFIHNFLKQNVTIKFPEIYNFTCYSELIEKYASMNTIYNIMGVVIHNKVTGERTKIRNPNYEYVRALRGNQPKLQYQYLSLRKDGKVKDYLQFYPENKNSFSEFRDQVHLFTETLFENYKICYIKKKILLKEFSSQYKNHIYQLHQIYMRDLRENKLFISKKIVQDYVNNLHPSLLMYSLNFQMRKRHLDSILSENKLL